VHERVDERLQTGRLEGRCDVSNGLLQSGSTDKRLFEADERRCVGEVEELLPHGRISTDVVGLDPVGDLEGSDMVRDVVELYGIHDEFQTHTEAQVEWDLSDWVEGDVEIFELIQQTEGIRDLVDVVEGQIERSQVDQLADGWFDRHLFFFFSDQKQGQLMFQKRERSRKMNGEDV
jgi:hypothetical protein